MAINGPIISIEDDEDDQLLIEIAVKTLKISNELHFFPNGQEALDYLETTAEKPLLILCDVNMPLMNGLELRKRINENEYLRRKSIPFIFLTTRPSQEDVQIAYDQTVQGFYEKPVQYKELQKQISLIVEYWQNCLHPNRGV